MTNGERPSREAWADAFAASPERDADFTTLSGRTVDPVYGPADGDFPGEFPYTRGPYASMYWALWTCNVIIPQLLWFKRIRQHPAALFLLAGIINIGMWLERYVIIVISLSRDFLPSSWGMYQGSPWDWSMFLGSMGLFVTLLYLFIRFLPVISIFEMRTMLPTAEVREGHT